VEEETGSGGNAVEVGSLQDATAAIARLLAVTHAGYERRAQLERALESRISIEQAKGIVAERHGLDVENAFAAIRRAARTNRLKLHDLVGRIRPGEPDPPELADALDALRRARA
jgi:ANTAR domain